MITQRTIEDLNTDYFNITLRLKALRYAAYWAGLLLCTLGLCIASVTAFAQDLGQGFRTPNSVEGTLAETAERQKGGALAKYGERKKGLEDRTGLTYGLDNYTQYLGTGSDRSPSDAPSNVSRFYGTWTAMGRGTPNNGTLVFKTE